MNRIKQKLRSKDGMSIVIALLGFMVAAMVSVVIVTAAVTAAERVSNDTKETQAHLTLESAAQVVADELENTEYDFKNYTADKTSIDTSSEENIKVTGTFSSEIKAAVEWVNTYNTAYKSSEKGTDFTVALTSGVSDTEIAKKVILTEDTDPDIKKKQVKVSYVMKTGDDKYDLTLTLKTEDPEDEIYITADGYCTTEPVEIQVGTTKEPYYQITWTVVSINRVALATPTPASDGGSGA